MQLTNHPIKIHQPVCYDFSAYGLSADPSEIRLGAVVEIALASKEHLQICIGIIVPGVSITGQIVTYGGSIGMGEIVRFGFENVMIL